MKLMPWKPRMELDLFEDIGDIQREMNRLFDFTLHRPLKRDGGTLWLPPVDMIDEKDRVCVRADLPGMKRDEIEITLDNDVLTIKGEKRGEKEIREKDYIRSERSYGVFHRSFRLPTGVDAQKINATYTDGVLEILLPKKEEAKTRQLKVDIK